MSAGAARQTRDLVVECIERYRGQPAVVDVLQAQLRRLDEPLRLALAGRVKAGKSTLLNAIVGEELAPTDTGECTRIVTWYRYGEVPSVRLVPRQGEPQPLPVRRDDGRLQLDTGDRPAHEVARLEVTWPAPALREITVVDTPGIASLSKEVSARATEVLAPGGASSEVDAVVYLMRHLHASDAELMEAFREASVGGASPVSTVAVISRADEIGGGRIDAMVAAGRIADRYRDDPRVRALALDVVPVAGLLAQGSRTLRQVEFDALRELSRLNAHDRDALMVSADRFTSHEHPGLVVAVPDVRRRLLSRLGFYGVRLATALLRGPTLTAGGLSRELARRSGLGPLREAVTTQLGQRAELLKVRSVLGALQRLLEAHPLPDGTGDELREQVEALLADDHALVELEWLARLRRGEPEGLDDRLRTEAEHLLGVVGSSPELRLRAPRGREPTGGGVPRAAAEDALDRWRRLLVDPLTEPRDLPLARTVVRSLDEVLLDLSDPVREAEDGRAHTVSRAGGP
ncbi:dynamin family protein [uncultured Ornithinimicrobium sp.]|uniref:dynamin family protein n=1 Tax=uncultured Ornithinimicrobium sp. TaxID=259307 RepID=UPI002596CA61|nr:dynamin family protein [uncultured Ornithinimicrobium sp.]